MLDRRTELIDGEIIQMPPIGPGHASTTETLAQLLAPSLGGARYIRLGNPLDLGDSQPQPDLAVVAGEPKDYRLAHPSTAELVVEISDTSLEYDRKVKSDIYAGAGIAEYWIVDMAGRRVEIHRDINGAGYAQKRAVGIGESVAPMFAPAFAIAVADLF